MTEKHIKQLQSLLSQSTPDESPMALDKRILQASIERTPEPIGQPSVWIKSLWMPLGFIRTASIAVSLTLVLFLGMGQLLTFENEDLLAVKLHVKESESVDVKGSSTYMSDTELATISKPIRELIEQAPIQIQRDKALLESIQTIGLPQTDELLATIEFVVDSDRALAQLSIDNAMDDIQSMIILGELNDARERYVQLKQVQLKQHCPPCRLPESLDDLLLAQAPDQFSTG